MLALIIMGLHFNGKANLQKKKKMMLKIKCPMVPAKSIILSSIRRSIRISNGPLSLTCATFHSEDVKITHYKIVSKAISHSR